MRRIAVINQKGGVGKTTTTVNIGAALARSGARVLLIDLDPQGHLSLHLGVELAGDQPNIYDVLSGTATLQEILVPTRDHTSVAPADIDLAGAEAELVSVTGREVLLRESVDTLDADFDYMLIDCPPSLGVLTINALVACAEVIIPMQAQFLALQGMGKLLDTIRLVRRRINPVLSVSGVVLCMYESSTRLGGEVVEDLAGFLESARGTDVPWNNASVFQSRIRRNIKLAEASSFGQSIFEYSPTCNGAADYRRLTAEVFGLDDHPEPRDPEPASASEGTEMTPIARQTDSNNKGQASRQHAGVENPQTDRPAHAPGAGVSSPAAASP